MNLQAYWNNRARYYSTEDVIGRTILDNFIRQINPVSLIEVGCGTGILFPLYKSVPVVSGCDFSETMLTRARQRCERHGYNVNLFYTDISEEAPADWWQLAVTRTCLMHIPPDKIEAAVANICRICDEALIFEFWQGTQPPRLSPHNWLHDYQRLFEHESFNLEYAYVREGIKQVLFWFKKVK